MYTGCSSSHGFHPTGPINFGACRAAFGQQKDTDLQEATKAFENDALLDSIRPLDRLQHALQETQGIVVRLLTHAIPRAVPGVQ